jgi:hypothetical protein
MGKHYIVYDKRVYCLNNEQYMALNERLAALAVAERNAKDMMDAEAEANDLFNFYNWITENIKPLSIESDNLDLHRYDNVCQKECCKVELPF